MRKGCRRRLALGALSVLLTLGVRAVDAPRFWLETRGGSWLLCEIESPTQPLFRTKEGSLLLQLDDIALLTFSPHDDPNLMNEALVASGDLGSDDFERRDHAVERLKKLGESARGALETACKSSDRETARQAHALLAALGDATPNDDTLTLRSGDVRHGSLVADELVVATRWRRYVFPFNSLRCLERCDKPVAAWTPHHEGSPEPCNDETEAHVANELFQPAADEPFNPGDTNGHYTLISADKVPERKKDGSVVWNAPVADRDLGDAYRVVNLWMRSVDVDTPIQSSMNGRMSLFQTSATKLELNFSAPLAPKESPHALAFRGEGKGVHSFRVALPAENGKVFIRAFDRNDRVIGTLPVKSVWAGFDSEIPIARIRLKYVPSNEAASTHFHFGPLTLGPRISPVARPNEACIYLSSGEIVSGEFSAIDASHFSLRPEFAAKSSAPLTFALDELLRLEAPWKAATQFVGPLPQHQAFFWPQDILLQTGDRLKAELLLLDDKQAVFELGQNVRLTLPRVLLRRVGFRRFLNDQENLNQTPEDAAAEKPGVKLFTKADLTNAAAPQANEVVDPKNNPAAGLQTVDNAEVVGFNAQQREITLRDKDGDFPFDASSVKALVFAPINTAAARKGTWRLILRNGLPLDAELLEIGAENLVLEIAGGKVQMPLERIDSIERIETPK